MGDLEGSPLINSKSEYVLVNGYLVDSTAYEAWLTFRHGNDLEENDEEFQIFASEIEEGADLSILAEGQLLYSTVPP